MRGSGVGDGDGVGDIVGEGVGVCAVDNEILVAAKPATPMAGRAFTNERRPTDAFDFFELVLFEERFIG